MTYSRYTLPSQCNWMRCHGKILRMCYHDCDLNYAYHRSESMSKSSAIFKLLEDCTVNVWNMYFSCLKRQFHILPWWTVSVGLFFNNRTYGAPAGIQCITLDDVYNEMIKYNVCDVYIYMHTDSVDLKKNPQYIPKYLYHRLQLF